MARASTTRPRTGPRAPRRSTSSRSPRRNLKLLFVCLGNICRSPTAEAVMRHVVAEADREDIVVESAGTGDWHIGHAPDPRSTSAAAGRGITLEGAARQVTPADFAEYDLLVAMDRNNHRDLLALAPDEAARSRVVLLRDHDPEATGDLDVPDPYYGGDQGFEDVLDIVDRSCRNLLSTL